MSKQMNAAGGVWAAPVAAEDNVAPDSVCLSIQSGCRLRGLAIRVDTHLAEIVPEARLEEGARDGI